MLSQCVTIVCICCTLLCIIISYNFVVCRFPVSLHTSNGYIICVNATVMKENFHLTKISCPRLSTQSLRRPRLIYSTCSAMFDSTVVMCLTYSRYVKTEPLLFTQHTKSRYFIKKQYWVLLHRNETDIDMVRNAEQTHILLYIMDCSKH